MPVRACQHPRPAPWTLVFEPATDTTSAPSTPSTHNTACCLAMPNETHGPFSCRHCHHNLTHLRSSAPPTAGSTHSVHDYLRCILLNTRSLHKHATEIWDLHHFISPNISFLTESWMNPSSAPDIATAIPMDTRSPARTAPTNHVHPQKHPPPDHPLRRPNDKHGIPPLPGPDQLQHHPPGHSRIQTSWPRLPLTDAIIDFIAPQTLVSTNYILLSNLNFHLGNPKDQNTASLLENLTSIGFKQLVASPTHSVGHTVNPHLLRR